MKSDKCLIYIIILSCCLLFLNYGCRENQIGEQNTQKETDIIQQEFTADEARIPILYFADLMLKKQFLIQKEYQNVLDKNVGHLQYDITHHGKEKSIFHHPVGHIQNTLSFQAITILDNAVLQFDIGIFTNNHEDFASDGVVFKIILEDNDSQDTIFEESLTEFDIWKSYALNLSEYAGKRIVINLITEPREHASYDWAVWGTPRLVNYSLDKEYERKELSSAIRYEDVIKYSQGMILPHQQNRIDRGWFCQAITTDIALAQIEINDVIRTELYVVEFSEKKDETIVFELLDKQDKILTTSTYHILKDKPLISHEYIVKELGKIPDKIRIVLDGKMASIVFIKEPILYNFRESGSKDKFPNIILISLDTLRADYLGCYGYERNVSPHIDALAEDGFIFTNAVSNSNWTLPSHTSMFTSLYPSQHQISIKAWDGQFRPYQPLYIYITEMFKKYGYMTGAITGGVSVGSIYGFNKGFDYHIEDATYQLTQQHLDMLLHFFEIHQDTPLFTFFHTYEIHEYDKERPNHLRYVSNNFQREHISLLYNELKTYEMIRLMAEYDMGIPNFTQVFDKIKDKVISREGKEYLRALYDGAISYTDDLLGEFFNELKEKQLYDDLWIILTSDHGEGLGEIHNTGKSMSWYHGTRLYNNQIKIPLIIKPPRHLLTTFSSERTIEQFVQTIDIPPTLSAIARITSPDQFNGKNLLNLLVDPNSFSEQVIFSEELNFVIGRIVQFSIIKDNYKLIMVPEPNVLIEDAYNYQLYNLKEDPLEEKNLLKGNLLAKHVPITNELKTLLWEHMGELLSTSRSEKSTLQKNLPESKREGIDEKHIRQLKDLGYL